jgi:hypothetical protein
MDEEPSISSSSSGNLVSFCSEDEYMIRNDQGSEEVKSMLDLGHVARGGIELVKEAKKPPIKIVTVQSELSGEGEINSRRSSERSHRPPMIIESFPNKRSLVIYAGDTSSGNTYSEGIDDALSDDLKETTFNDGGFWSRHNVQ